MSETDGEGDTVSGGHSEWGRQGGGERGGGRDRQTLREMGRQTVRDGKSEM